MNALWRWLTVAMIVCLPALALAHSGSASYLRLTDSARGLLVTLSVDLQDVEYAIGLDLDRNGEIVWGELLARQAALESYVRERVRLTRGAEPCELAFDDLAVDVSSSSVQAIVSGVTACAGEGLEVRSNLMFDLDVRHRTLVEWRGEGRSTLAVLTSTQREWRGAAQSGWLAQLSSFAWEGMLHIWGGIDHLAFLLVLLLPAFAMRTNDTNATAWKKLIAIVSTFTLAHSLTLALAATGVVNAPERPIEVAIAVSVIIAALANLLPGARQIGVPAAFAFGLLHGFGFASALGELDASRASFALALAGFNLGVEAGQLVVVAAALPIMLWLRTRAAQGVRIARAASLAVAVLGGVWVCERVAT